MYLKPEVIVSDWSEVEHFLSTHPLGLLTTALPLDGQSTIQASHLPFLFHPPSSPPEPCPVDASTSTNGTWRSSTSGDLGTLKCHLARTNPQAKALLSSGPNPEVLVVFSDPTSHEGYISPQWYKETKPATAKTVPTWNYTELQLYGTASITSQDNLHCIVTELSNTHEEHLARTTRKKDKWKVTDAPQKYIDLLERAIIGVEIAVTKVGFKMKMSREKCQGDRSGVIEGLKEVGSDSTIRIANTVERLGPYKKAS